MKMLPRSAVLCALALCCGALMFRTTVSASTDVDPCKSKACSHVLLIDAGSTGSRLHIYPYHTQDGQLPIVYNSRSLKIKPGLSSYAGRPQDAVESLKELMEFAKSHIPLHMWRQTPLYLMATAGLRSIATAQAADIIEACREEMTNWPFLFRSEHARIITGREEGVNGWVAVNYLKGLFRESGTDVSHGVIEMGGASLQVTFEVPKADLDKVLQQGRTAGMGREIEAMVSQVDIGHHTFHVYAHSYLSFGLQAAIQTFLRDASEDDKNVCFLGEQTGSPANYQRCDAVIDKILFKNDDQQVCPVRKDPPAGSFGRPEQLLMCTWDGVIQPLVRPDAPFVAIENFFYTPEFLEVPCLKDSRKQTNKPKVDDESCWWDSLQQKGADFCPKPLSQLESAYPGVHGVGGFCFSAAYITSVLRDGLKMSASQIARQVEIRHQIAGHDIDWALGAALMRATEHSNKMKGLVRSDGASVVGPLTNPVPDASPPFTTILFYILIVCVVGYAAWKRCKGQKSSTGGLINGGEHRKPSYPARGDDFKPLLA